VVFVGRRPWLGTFQEYDERECCRFHAQALVLRLLAKPQAGKKRVLTLSLTFSCPIRRGEKSFVRGDTPAPEDAREQGQCFSQDRDSEGCDARSVLRAHAVARGVVELFAPTISVS